MTKAEWILPPLLARIIPAAPILTLDDKCGDCNVQFIWAGNYELKVCPQCYALLWHVKWQYKNPKWELNRRSQ